jgi:iron(III) transport system substrate-binding protein
MSGRFLRIPIIALLVVVLVACGGSAPTPNTGSAPTTQAPTEVAIATEAPATLEATAEATPVSNTPTEEATEAATEATLETDAPTVTTVATEEATESPAATEGATEGPASTATATDAPVTAGAASEGGSLVVYSGRSEALVAPIIAQFSEATGIKVDVRYGSTAEMAATLLEEGTNSPADVFFAQDPGGLGAVAQANLFAPLPEDVLGRVPERFRSPDGLWVGISGRARVVVYNTATVQPDALPADIYDFVDPKWSGRIGWVPSNGSFQAMLTAMRQSWGEDKTRQWLEGIKANQPVAFENNAAAVEGVAAGEADVAFVNHYYLYRFLREQGESFGARNAFLTGGGPGSLIMVAGAGRLVNGPNEANALRFLQFMLSPVAQQYFSSQTSEYPLVEGVVTPVGLPPLADLEATALDIDMADLDDLQGTVAMLQETGILP